MQALHFPPIESLWKQGLSPASGSIDNHPYSCIIVHMSREKQRQAQRLRKLADFIQANPEEYIQNIGRHCIIGLGNRLVRGKLGEYVFSLEPGQNFAKRYGVPVEVANHIYAGSWNQIPKSRGAVDVYGYSRPSDQRRGAVRLLRNLAKQVEKGGLTAR